jgi:hypothetical protein
MNQRQSKIHSVVLLSSLSAASPSFGSVTTTTSYDTWAASTGSVTTLDFVFPQAQILNTQYADLGVIFPDAEEVAYSGNFPLDGWGCKGSVLGDDDIVLSFAEQRTSFGCFYKGAVFVEFWSQGVQQYVSPTFFQGTLTVEFGGIFNAPPFDTIVIKDPDNFIFVDNIVFGAAVPGPAAWAVLVLSVSRSRRRRT